MWWGARFLVLLAVTSCGGSIVISRSGPRQAARSADCPYRMYTVPPSKGFIEIGSVDVSRGSAEVASEITDFKRQIRPYVCAAGGDAAIAFANNQGLYLRATILKREAAAEEPAASAAAAQDLDCHYDTQCKGDRVCEGGRCVSPTAPGAVPAPAAPVFAPVSAPVAASSATVEAAPADKPGSLDFSNVRQFMVISALRRAENVAHARDRGLTPRLPNDERVALATTLHVV